MKQLLAALGLTFGMTAVAHAGVVLHNVTQFKDKRTGTSEGFVYVQNGMLRSEQRDAHGQLEHLMIFRDDAVWQFDVHDHSYLKMDRATMQRMTAQMPPALRAMMEKMNGGGGAAKGESGWRDTGKTEHVGQYTCHVWTGALMAQANEYCIVAFDALPGGGELRESLQQVGRIVKEVLSGSYLAAAANEIVEYQRFNGIPAVSRRDFGDTYLKGVEQKKLPAETFQIPDGYQQKQLPFGPARPSAP